MRQRWLLATMLVALVACSESPTNPAIERTLFDGQHIFRFDTFGDEAFWTDTLKMHQVVQGISPKTALGVGLKVDVDALPAALVSQLQAVQVNLDDPLAPGMGRRLDGWPNRDLNPALILSLSPALQAPAAHAVLTSWRPGKYDAHWNHDNQNGPVLIPPAYGLAGVNLETYTGA